jgi:hypothetical protein
MRRPPPHSLVRAVLGLLLALSSACVTEEPVLLGVEPDPEPAPTERAKVWQRVIPDSAYRDDPVVVAQAYSKPAGVYVDIHWLGGRRYDDIAAELEAQLGPLHERKVLDSRKGEELVYERGEVRVLRGVVYMLRVRLPEPLTRSDALLSTGFSIYADHWRETHREFRLSNSFEFERFRLMRDGNDKDRVVSVEAWKLNPDDVRR